MNKLWYLSQISMFNALPKEDLMEMEKMGPMSTLERNTIIQTPETFHEGLYTIKEGKLRLYKMNAEGKQFTLGILGKGNLFGEIDSFSLGTRDIFIETIDKTLLCSFGKEQFEAFLTSRPQLALKFLKVLSERLQERDALLEQLALGDLRDRVLHLLMKLSKQFGIEDGDYHKIDFSLTHQELANMVGATRESVTMVLKELSKRDIVRTGRMSIEVNINKAKEYIH
ncbi:Crp/Fnr family transcriptional regulator [Aneurinibacillus sp. Ricciae_BoGa-3]|uniref:Crp/Fnr family transcriptional regulator n=1 Tax=Aneurinibacillus sp. Ricciae_BoGa-3 TaxID=3022697 RepID=UPI0023420C70|nr:Crp/Fnr family transcriptional regulator [Aneurinibacillus sp. Ricciae_BoGa-3]WCK52960.1 Crp/Fnr family transcriptional regulator [Aneurinibacillus sp. Ricciae_BoGa-3]